MLSYQHAYHAGNLADVHKHAALAWALAYLTAKPKPLSYIETHAGRGLYRLSGPEAQKTGEAEAGVRVAEPWFAPDHPYRRLLEAVRAEHGPDAYPGSPVIAARSLRPGDRMHLAELHPAEFLALKQALPGVHVQQRDGGQMALALCPPEPRRGLCLIDPSYEVKDDYEALPRLMARLHRKWPVGCLMLWYPVLTTGAQAPMLRALHAALPEALTHEVGFAPARAGHRMVGSGLFVVNPPYGLAAELARIGGHFAAA